MTLQGDIEIDELRNPEIFGIGRIFITDDFKMGAIAMLKLISKYEGWEESEQVYYEEFIAKYNHL